jgi:hypothetical protein
MIKYFCDSCGKEKKSLRSVDIPCHLFSMFKGHFGDYVDNKGVSISGRVDIIHLCNECCNVFYTNGLKSISLLGGKND